MTIGTVKWFNPTKGYGFIQPEDGSQDVFVHISAVERSGIGNLHEGQKVSFDLEARRSGKDLGREFEAELASRQGSGAGSRGSPASAGTARRNKSKR